MIFDGSSLDSFEAIEFPMQQREKIKLLMVTADFSIPSKNSSER